MSDPVDLLRGAIADASPNYMKVTVEQLHLDTPCEGWDLKALLNHAFSRLDLSARAARSEAVDDFAIVEVDHVDGDPGGAFTRLTADALEAWGNCEDLETPRVTPIGLIPPEGILLFGSQDLFIHAWDVAKTIGEEPELSPEMVKVFAETHRQSVDEQSREMFFAEPVAVADNASPLDKLVAFLGRQP